MTTDLIKYEAARSALAECHRVDEVKDIRDKAQAMALYAKQAKDKDLVLWATEIKARAERKAGEMLRESASRGERVGRSESGRRAMAARWDNKSDDATIYVPSLDDLGISKRESHRWQKVAGIPEPDFEAAIATAKETEGQVTSAFLMREANKHRAPARRVTKADKERLAEMDRQRAAGISMVSTYARLLLTAMGTQEGFTEGERELLAQVAESIQQVNATAKG